MLQYNTAKKQNGVFFTIDPRRREHLLCGWMKTAFKNKCFAYKTQYKHLPIAVNKCIACLMSATRLSGKYNEPGK